MKNLIWTILICIFAASLSFAGDVHYNNHPTLWKDADILIWSPSGAVPVESKEFCLSLKRNNTSIGDPKCRTFGEWERDSISERYALWLQNNIEPKLKPEYLKARHPAMSAKIQTLEDKIVLYLATKGNQILVAIFDETTAEPRITGTVANTPDKVALSDEIASKFFNAPCKRRLSKEERKKLQTEPDDYYKEVPNFQGWVGVSAGYSQAKIPLTPDSWYNSHTRSRVRNYRITKDSTSLWNFFDDSVPLYTAYVGGTWYGFIGAEIFYRFARHHVKTDDSDTLYKELDYWYFDKHEIGINAMLSQTYTITKWLDIVPFAFIGFQYAFFSESIDLKEDVKQASREYDDRLELESSYKGALVGFGSQFKFFKHYGIDLRTGISSRGRNIYSDPSPDAAAEPTTIGASTIDWFISAGLEYHWTVQ